MQEPENTPLLPLWPKISIAGLSTLLGACAEEPPPPRDTGKTGTDDVDADMCGCMGPPATGTTPGGATPTPGGGTTTPGGGTTTPGGGATTPVAESRLFSFLGPDTAALNVRGATMMSTLTQTMADGRAIRVWGFGNGFNSDRAVPGPVIELTEGQPAAITLSSMMPHTLHPHGLDVDQANDGVPTTSQAVSMATGPFTYQFVAPHAGSYAYHCHVDTVLHMEMGMSGTIIVRPPDGRANQLWNGGPTFEREAIWQLHTFDSRWHRESRSGPATTRYTPDYFMINGRDGVNLLSDPTVAIQAQLGETVAIRLVNLGYLPTRISVAGLVLRVVASDGRPLRLSLNRAQLLVNPGERYDVLLSALTAGSYTASVDYLDIRGVGVLGSAVTQVSFS